MATDTNDTAWLWAERLLKGVALLGGLVLLAVMALVSLAVYYRYVLNEPILGDNELVQIGMSLVVMMAMPYAALKGAHIRVDFLDQAMGAWGRFLGDLFARSVMCFVIYMLLTKSWDKTLDAYEYEDVTNMIEIPVWIAYAAITVGMGLFGLVTAGQLVQQIRRGPSHHE